MNDVVKDGLDFVSGVGRGIAASESLGVVGAPSSSDSLANRLGQVIGTVAAGVAGAGASVAGGGVIIATEGAAAPIAAPGALAGAGVAIGAAKNVGAILTTPMEARSQGPKASEAQGVTANGQATDKYGNKLGPSGEPQVNATRSNTREGARNKALNEGGGATNHNNPKDGQRPHFHPTDGKGQKKPTSTHHNYPE